MKIDGSDRREIYKDPQSPAFFPAWSSQGDVVAFTRGRVFAGGSTDNEIYVVQRGEYGELGALLIAATVLGFILPVGTILLFGRKT